jgi:D-glycero-alpha-D-manno-heptose 1-phosphate guanylyltransferase
MEAIVLAGGLGSRLRSTVPNLPKPLAPIGEKPFLDYLLDYWQAQGVKHFILSVGYKEELIRNYFGDKYKNSRVDYIVEKKPLGTGGGLLLSVKSLKLNQPFLVLNGDTLFKINLSNLLKHHSTCKADMTLSLSNLADNSRYSEVLLDKSGKLIRSLKRRSKTSNNKVSNGGVYLLEPTLLDDYKSHNIKYSLEDELLPDLLKKNKRIAGFVSKEKFIDIGRPEDYRRAEKIL